MGHTVRMPTSHRQSVRSSTVLLVIVSLLAVAGIAVAAAATTTSNAPSVFVPGAPCRAVDTRHGAGPIPRGTVYSFVVTGTASLASQGGNAAGCGVPSTATAVTLNLTVTGTTGDGYISVYAAGGVRPTASTLNWIASGQTIANGTVAQVGLSSGVGMVSVYASDTTSLVADITGYYVPGAGAPGPSGPSGPPGSPGASGLSGAAGKSMYLVGRDGFGYPALDNTTVMEAGFEWHVFMDGEILPFGPTGDLYYATTDCSGTAYLSIDQTPPVTNIARSNYYDGSLPIQGWAIGSETGVQPHSWHQLVAGNWATCQTVNLNTTLAVYPLVPSNATWPRGLLTPLTMELQ